MNISAADLQLRATLEHVQARPHSVFGLAMACADRMQSGMNMRGLAGPGGETMSELNNFNSMVISSKDQYYRLQLMLLEQIITPFYYTVAHPLLLAPLEKQLKQ